MTHVTARHVNETESDRRGIKDGWYVMSQMGKICSGRFSNREDCQAQIKRERADIDANRHGADTLLQNSTGRDRFRVSIFAQTPPSEHA
jgi:hypothetical protein